MTTAALGGATVEARRLLEFQSITKSFGGTQALRDVSIVVGGVLLTGGFGSVAGIFLGALTFAVVNQGIYFTDIDRNWSNLIIGVMLMAAVLMNDTFRQMALSFAPNKKK
jgi:ribose/xylose/arabinose/galactoside ABC-type transport system permease subunit